MTTAAPAIPFAALVTLANGEVWAFERCHGSRGRSWEKRGPMGGLGVRAWGFPSADKAKEKAEAWLASSGYEVAKVEVLPVEEVEAKAAEDSHNRMVSKGQERDRKFVVELYGNWVAEGKDLSVNKWGDLNNRHARLLVSNRIIDRAGNFLTGKPISFTSDSDMAKEWLKEEGLL